tara:strand:- start:314 stop:826 length:513 start_codon:yes stop_codon:yes gene_type:complete
LEDTNTEIKPQYSKLAKTMHWGFVLLFAYGVFKQVDSINELADPSLFRLEIIFAGIFVILLLARFAYMKKTQRSALPENTNQLQKIAAKFVHMGMYVSLGSIAMTGLAIGGLYWLGLQEGLIIEAVISIHEFSVSATYWLVAVHILGAIFHRLKNDGVWTAMVPFSKESS